MSGYAAVVAALLLLLTLSALAAGSRCGPGSGGRSGGWSGAGSTSGAGGSSEALLAECALGLREASGCEGFGEKHAPWVEGFAAANNAQTVARARSLLDKARSMAAASRKALSVRPGAVARGGDQGKRERAKRARRRSDLAAANKRTAQAATRCLQRENAACVYVLRQTTPGLTDGEARAALDGCFRAADKDQMCRRAAAGGVPAARLVEALPLMKEHGPTQGIALARGK